MNTGTGKIGPLSRILLILVGFYRLTLSSLMGRTCRHLPTCSDYASEAITRFGAWRGGMLALSRIWRCNPWGTDGYDPVPDTLPDHGWRVWRYGKWRGTPS